MNFKYWNNLIHAIDLVYLYFDYHRYLKSSQKITKVFFNHFK